MAIWKVFFELSTTLSLDVSPSQQGSGVDQMNCGVEPSLPVQPPVKLEREVESTGDWRRSVFDSENLSTQLTFHLTESSVQHVGLVYCKNHSKLLENVNPDLDCDPVTFPDVALSL